MAHVIQLPCNGDGMCMRCKETPVEEEQLCCKTCATPWHVACLVRPPESLASTLLWECPDCTGDAAVAEDAGQAAGGAGGIVAEIMAIEADVSLTESEKARRRQELLSGKAGSDGRGGDHDGTKDKKGKHKVAGDGDENELSDIFGGSLNCSFCMQLPERPVTTPCGHNFCLKCFQKWIGQGKKTCAKCRCIIPSKMAGQPRINSTLVAAIRMAKRSNTTVPGGPSKIYHFVHNQDRPDKAYTTERAKRKGKANAASGKIFVTLPPDHFGPILAENDPERNQGVLVGESWEGRLECRQWGVHYPPVAGIAGQSKCGAQSVVLSGGYEDDEDHGEWFLYTGSGGRDLSGNKRTNKNQSFDQKFLKLNEALRVSCKQGYPVRVVRSFKEKRSSYAPEKGLRYDGIYRIEECWRKIGVQGFKVCRYLFVRCDNDPAPWTSDDHGDHPRPLPEIPELKNALDITKRKERPSWDFDELDGCWKWIKPPPLSRVVAHTGKSDGKKSITVREKLLKEFSCFLCKQVMAQPVTTPCAHNFCKSCLEEAFSGKSFVRERSRGGRALRSQKTIMKCPSCTTDISDFLKDPQVNRELMEVIESLKQKTEEDDELAEESNDEGTDASEGISNLAPESSKSSGKHHEETIVTGCSHNLQVKCTQERASKRKKVDVEDSLGRNNDGEEATIAAEKPDDGLDVDSEADQKVGSKDTKAEEEMEEENDSPASPLLMPSDDQDSA
ncbi:E3 ubiquitin-protein ligase ORTHRUS 2 [Citrus sinensis]|nr:E3 ubiquitin-protein ligase ORTHRUS 2 [Citrus sinensis]